MIRRIIHIDQDKCNGCGAPFSFSYGKMIVTR